MMEAGEGAPMLFRLTQDWPVGSAGGTRLDITVPTGVQIDGTNPQWQGTPLPSMMPITAIAMDEEAALALMEWYPEHWHWLHFGPGLHIDPIKARAAYEKRFPGGAGK